ncbi:MAG: cell division protein FtsQ/DivIB [Prevotellaceae bacterium]|jgi:cell division protein FtsQ|nr:cell division protein FtsQ/DivIB [Prevotellaceae bacterium]
MAKKKIAWRRVILSFVMFGLIVCLFVYILNIGREVPVCKGIDIQIKNAEVAKLVTQGDFRKLIEQSKIAGKGKPLNDDVVKKTLKLLESKGSVKNVVAYQAGDSILHVELEQRMPVARILTALGSYYLDDEGIVFPVSERYTYDVPLVTGKMQLPREGRMLRDSAFSRNLLEFVDYISKDLFWNAQIQQIDIDKEKNVEFVVCSDNHLIRFGQLNGYKDKLDNLLAFYTKVNPYYREKDNSVYTVLDLRFNKQIVAVKSK